MRGISGEMYLLRIFIGEGDRHGRSPLYDVLVELFRKNGIAGATVLRGIAGYGAASVYHTDKLLRLSGDLPIVVEAVDTKERLESLLEEVDLLMTGGMITMEKVHVISYRADGGGNR